jgi:hypothetical protein
MIRFPFVGAAWISQEADMTSVAATWNYRMPVIVSGSPLAARSRADIPPGSEFHQLPVFGIEAQGSAGARCSPSCKSSSEMPSGVRAKAM